MSPTGLLYLHHQHLAVAGQGAILGNRLFAFLQKEFDSVITAHMVVDSESLARAHSSFLDDVIGVDELSASNIGVIYCEGGIESDFCENGKLLWKIEQREVEAFARRGGIVIAADLDWNFAYSQPADFCDLFQAWFLTDHDQSKPHPVYLVDPGRSRDANWKRVSIDVTRMGRSIESWLIPVYEGISELLVHGALQLQGYQSALAFMVSDTVGSLCDDAWWSPPRTGFDLTHLRYHSDGPMGPDLIHPFASVRQLGSGFLVAITGQISSDSVMEECPANATWVKNIAKHLRTVSESHNLQFSFQRFRGKCIFLSHRSMDKPFVELVAQELRRRGVQFWLDKDRLIPSDSVGISIKGGLSESTHFALFWSKNCTGAPWIEFELGAAIQACVEQHKPIFVVPIDDTPVPAGINQYLRLKIGSSAGAIAQSISEAITALDNRKKPGLRT
jgi:hypothetical protein